MSVFRALFVALVASHSAALRCLEGADCLRDASCEECEGVACTRITSFSLEDNKEIALTCIPHDTRLGFPQREIHLEEDGCRNSGDRQICVCYNKNYCNSSSDLKKLVLFVVITLSLTF